MDSASNSQAETAKEAPAKQSSTETDDDDAPAAATGDAPQTHKTSLFTSKISRVLSKMDFEHSDPGTVVDMLRSPSTKVMSALSRKLKRCDSDWIEGFLDAQGFDVSVYQIHVIRMY